MNNEKSLKIKVGLVKNVKTARLVYYLIHCLDIVDRSGG